MKLRKKSDRFLGVTPKNIDRVNKTPSSFFKNPAAAIEACFNSYENNEQDYKSRYSNFRISKSKSIAYNKSYKRMFGKDFSNKKYGKFYNIDHSGSLQYMFLL